MDNIIEDVNSKALARLDVNKYEGKCVGLANGKVVVSDKSVKQVMKTLAKNYSNKQTAVVTFPKKDKILVL